VTANLKKRVLLVIPVHDRPDDLASLLASLNKLILTHLELAVVVVDDGSPRPLDPKLASNFKKGRLLWYRNETPQGPGPCRNLGAEAAASDYLWFLDSDTEVINPHTLGHMVAVLAADPQLAGVGGVLEDCRGALKIQELDILPNFTFLYRAFPPEAYDPAYVDGIGTCNLLLGRQAFERAGGFWKRLKRDEDNDLCLTLSALGYRFYQDAQTVVRHKCSPSGRQSGAFAHFTDPQHYFRDLLETRLLLLAKHRPGRLPLLPVLDSMLLPVIRYRLKTGTYASSRLGLAVSGKSRLNLANFLLITSLQGYLRGLGLFFKYLLGWQNVPPENLKP